MHGEDPKIICCIDRLLELAESKRQFCQMPCKRFTKVVGCALELNMVCSAGHSYNWASSLVLTNSNTTVMCKINLAFPSVLLLSGNNYRISGIIRGRKVSQITFFTIVWEKTFAIQAVLYIKIPSEIKKCKKAFANSSRFAKFTNFFSRRQFSIYGIINSDNFVVS